MEIFHKNIEKVQEFLEKNEVKYIMFFMLLLFSSSIALVDQFSVIKIIKNLYIILFPILLFVVLIKKKQLKMDIKDVNLMFLILCLYSIITVIWSQARGQSFKNSILLLGTTIIAIYIGKNFKKDEVFKILLIWFTLMVVINLLCLIFRAPFIFDLEEKRYSFVIRGIFKHRNTLGLYMNMTITLCLWFILNLKNNKKLRNLCILNIIGASILLYLSKSMTSMLLLGVFIFLLILTRYKKFNKLLIYSIVPVILFLVYLIVNQPNWYVELLGSIGRNPTLTNRSVIWKGCLAGIQTKPLLGYGYTGYWSNNIYSVNFVATFYGGLPVNAHNGYLDIILDFGVLGALFIIPIFFITMSRVKKLNNCDKIEEMKYLSYSLSFIVFILIQNLIESPIIRHISTNYILIIICFNIIQQLWNKHKID